MPQPRRRTSSRRPADDQTTETPPPAPAGEDVVEPTTPPATTDVERGDAPPVETGTAPPASASAAPPAPPPPPTALTETDRPDEPRGRRERGLRRGDRVGPIGASLFGILVVAVGILLLYVLVKIWPSVPKSGGTATAAEPKPPAIHLLSWRGHNITFHLIPDTALIALTAIMGAIGSTIFIAISFADYVGNRRFAKRWVWFYLVRLFTGPALALIFYFALRGGFLATTSQSSDINPYGIAALAGLVGLFSKQAGDKLHQIFGALFQVDAEYGDAARGDGITNPAPTLAGIDPPAIHVGTDQLDFVVEGTGFMEETTVTVGSVAAAGGTPTMVLRQTAYQDPEHLLLTLDAADVKAAGTLFIAVSNPPPGGGSTAPQAFAVTEPPPAPAPGE